MVCKESLPLILRSSEAESRFEELPAHSISAASDVSDISGLLSVLGMDRTVNRGLVFSAIGKLSTMRILKAILVNTLGR